MSKPIVDRDLILSANPSKNYILNLLRKRIREINPSRSLDAGVGLLRNYWMFPNHYSGTSVSACEVRAALGNKRIQRQIRKRKTPKIYISDLDSDLSHLGFFDLCVCTHTLEYVSNPGNTVRYLSRLVVQGGAIILQGQVKMQAEIQQALGDEYGSVEIVYYGVPESDFQLPAYDIAEYERLAEVEASAANVPDGHNCFFIVARNKF